MDSTSSFVSMVLPLEEVCVEVEEVGGAERV